MENANGDDGVLEAVSAFLMDPTALGRMLRSGRQIDIPAAVAARRRATLVVKDVHARGEEKRVAILSAIHDYYFKNKV